MNATETTQENETRVNVEINICEEAAHAIISVLGNAMMEMGEYMDDEEYNDLDNLIMMLREEVY
tara:strand:- start:252 stop:443 length:192 start_codon:yes stop_codon:yes gene_type:complete